MQRSLPTHAYKPPTLLLPTSYFLSQYPLHSFMLVAILLFFLLPLRPDSLRVLQWNAGSRRTRNTEVLHFISFHPVDLICIQGPNLNLSFSFGTSDYSDQQFVCTHLWSGTLSPDDPRAGGGGGVIIFVMQRLSFSEHFTYSLSSLDLTVTM